MRLLKLAALTTLVAGCATVHVAPFTAAPDRAKLNSDQRQLWRSADERDDALRNIGADYDDPVLKVYIQAVLDRLYPELKGAMQVHLLKSTAPDAFMMANGSCYVQLGLLPLLQDESSLALVLSHEDIHFVDQHAVEEHASTGNVEKAMEIEADRSGYERYLRAGYPAANAPAPFVALDKYFQATDSKDGDSDTGHPKLQDRIAYFTKAAEGAPVGDTGAARYQAATAAARLWVLQELVTRHDHKALIFLLEDPTRATLYPDASFYLAEGYLFRAGDGDSGRAEKMYRQLIEKDPAFAPSYAALGKLLMQRGDTAGAKPLFETYLKLAPDAPDRAYIQLDLQHLTNPQPAG